MSLRPSCGNKSVDALSIADEILGALPSVKPFGGSAAPLRRILDAIDGVSVLGKALPKQILFVDDSRVPAPLALDPWAGTLNALANTVL